MFAPWFTPNILMICWCQMCDILLFIQINFNINNQIIKKSHFFQHLAINRKCFLWKIFLILTTFLQPGLSSSGDSNYIFHNCLYSCYLSQCNLTHVRSYIDPASKSFEPCNLSFIESAVKWNCEDECKYHCMWKTVNEILQVSPKIHQFFGKVSSSPFILNYFLYFSQN